MVVILMFWAIYTVLHTGAHLPPLLFRRNLHFSSEALGFLKKHQPCEKLWHAAS